MKVRTALKLLIPKSEPDEPCFAVKDFVSKILPVGCIGRQWKIGNLIEPIGHRVVIVRRVITNGFDQTPASVIFSAGKVKSPIFNSRWPLGR